MARDKDDLWRNFPKTAIEFERRFATKGALWHGTWAIKDNTACTDWKEFPNNPCNKYDKQGDAVMQINAVTGQPRGKILKTADGNAEKLAP